MPGWFSIRAQEYLRSLRVLILALLPLTVPSASLQALESASPLYKNSRSAVSTGGRRQSVAGFTNQQSIGPAGASSQISGPYAARGGLMAVAFQPGKLTGLFASTGTAGGTIDLEWVAPGNDGYAPGTSAGAYVIKYSTTAGFSPAQSETLFNAAASVAAAVPTPAAQGSRETLTLSGLIPSVTYYFAFKARERDGIPGVLSAGATAYARHDLPAGCGSALNVKQDNTRDFTTIQAAVAASPASPTWDTCVVVRDTQTYSEQVTVQGKSMGGYRLKIMADPTFVSSAPVINPPTASTAAFHVMNDSVTLQHLTIITTNTVAFGIRASSAQVTLSSVNVDSGGRIWTAGIRVSSGSAIANSSVTVQNAHGLWVTGSTNTVTSSTMTAAAASRYALYLNAASYNTVTDAWISGSAHFSAGAAYNTIDLSTMTSAATTADRAALSLNGSSNTVSRSYVFNSSNGDAAYLDTNATNNTISRSTITTSSFNETFWWLGSSNTVTESHISNPSGNAIILGGNNNTIRLSTVTNSESSYSNLAITGSSHTVTQSYIAHQTGGDAFTLDGNYNTISLSTITTSGSGGRALFFTGALFNTVTRSVIANPLGTGFRLQTGSDYNTVSLSTITSTAAGYYALSLADVSTNTINACYVQGSSAVFVSGSTGTVLSASVLVATNTSGAALSIGAGNVNVTVTSTTLTSGSGGTGLALAEGNTTGELFLSSLTVLGSRYGLSIATQAAGASLTVSSITFRDLAQGATAVQFLGGTFVSTFTLAYFDAGVGANVNASLLDSASTITMHVSMGPRRGLWYENDPQGLVDWDDLLPAGAPSITAVYQSSITVAYGLVDSDGYIVEASTRSDFTPIFASSATGSAALAALSPQSLDPNTTYYLRAGASYNGNYLYNATVLSTPTWAKAVSGLQVYDVALTTITANWLPLPTAAQQGSSNSAQGYVLYVSSRADFTPLWTSSRTTNVSLSTLTAASLYGGTTYYFRVGSLNWAGAVQYGVSVSTLLPIQMGVELTTHTLTIPGLANVNTSLVISTSIIATNTGNFNEAFRLRATTTTGGSTWQIGATAGVDRYVVWSVVNSTQPATIDFGAEDRLDDPEITPTGAIFTMGNETAVQVPPGESRVLWFQLGMPTAVTTGASQQIRIDARAIQSP